MSARSYQPDIAPEYWAQIGPFVTACVAEAAPACAYSERELFAAATPFVLWAWRSAGLELDRAVMFQVAVIDRFATGEADTYRTNAGRNTLRSRLLRMSEALNPGAAKRTLRPLGGSVPAVPYTVPEVTELRSWALSQRTEQRRRDAGALLALGLGAGLSGREILEVRAADIVEGASGVDVLVRGERPRRVPVLHVWEQVLLERAGGEAGDGFAFRAGRTTDNPNLITDFVSRGRTRIQVQARRMRATWIVTHLNAGTPAVALIRAAGVESLAALDRFLPYADTTAELDESLRGGAGRQAGA